MNVKDVVLKTLMEAKSSGLNGGFVSGEELARFCGVSRMSIWKAVKTLKTQGVAIDAATNKGYRYLYTDVFTKDSLTSLLTEKDGFSVRFYDMVDSTNTQAKRLIMLEDFSVLNSSLHKTVIVSASQSDGYGRFGRSFFSPCGTGIYFSIIYIPKSFVHPGFITASAAVGLCRSIKKIFDVDCGIKWANDIIVSGKKVAGILTEGITDFESGSIQAVVIGCGINIVPDNSFPKDLMDKAGSICSNNIDTKRNLLCASSVKEILAILDGDDLYRTYAFQEYRNRSVLRGKKICVHPVCEGKEKSYDCTVLDILDNAVLSVRREDGTVAFINSGEVTLCDAV